MKISVRRIVFLLAAIIAAIVCVAAIYYFVVCSGEVDWMEHPIEQTKRLKSITPRGAKKLVQMSPEDIIVAVNGYPLRKKEYDVWMLMLKKIVYKRMKNSLGEADKLLDEMRAKFVDQFVSNRMLIDDAYKYNIITEESLREKVKEELTTLAEKEKTSVDGLLRRYGNFAKCLVYQTAERIIIRELVAQKIPPLTEVDMTFVSNTQAQVSHENDIASATNSLRRQLMEQMRADISSGRATFDAKVAQYENDGRFEIGDGGEWDTVSRDEMNNPTLEEIVFSAKEGDLLPLQEDSDGIDLVMLKHIIPAEREKNGDIREAEKRELVRIRMTKEPLFLRQSDEAMFQDLKSQMQLQAVDAYVENLATNGSVKVVYPYGKELF